MKPQLSARRARQAYRVNVSMFPEEWDQLKGWAFLRGITGGELIQSVLTIWLAHNPLPDEAAPADLVPEDA